MKDYYQILGVTDNAGASEIKRAYRKLAVIYHPDKNPDPTAEQFFKEVNEAYDVLGDDNKRRDYDFKRQNPFSNISLPVEPMPYHRDRAYHRKRNNNQRKGKPTTEDLMIEYLPYFKWLIWAGLGFLALFIADFSLPLQASVEQIDEIYSVKRRNSYSHTVILTTSEKEIIVYDGQALNFQHETEILIKYTPILHAVLRISDLSETNVVKLRGIYGPVFIMPILLFLTSIAGFFLRNNIVYSFNISVTIGILIILVVYLILST